MGGIGTRLIHPLCCFLNHGKFDTPVELTIVDGDKYEERNRNRQMFSKIGNKAEVTVESIAPLYPNVNFFSVAMYLADSNAVRIVREGDIVLACVDNDKSRKILTNRCKDLKNVSVLSGGNELTTGTVQCWLRRNGDDVTLPLDNPYYGFKVAEAADEHPEEAQARRGCEIKIESGEVQTLAANNFVAAVMLNCFVALLDGTLDCDIVYLESDTNKVAARKRDRAEITV